MKLKNTVLLSAMGLLLAGCAAGTDDLESWMKSEGAKMKGQVAPLPPVVPFTPIPYAGIDMPDPFAPKRSTLAGANAPDQNRKKEFLESFPLDRIKMVGIIKKKGIYFGLVRSPDNNVNTVQLGNYMGQNYGRIVDISDAGMLLKESIQDPQGEWVERDVPIELIEK